MDKIEIEQKANELREASGIEDIFPTPFDAIFRHIGYLYGIIEKKHLKKNPGYSNISCWLDRSKKIIGVNFSEARQKRYFQMAHQIGHLLLHTDAESESEVKIDYRESKNSVFTDKPPKEREANYFAACLLMPASEFKKQHLILRKNPFLIGDYFDVSFASVEIRTYYLKL